MMALRDVFESSILTVALESWAPGKTPKLAGTTIDKDVH